MPKKPTAKGRTAASKAAKMPVKKAKTSKSKANSKPEKGNGTTIIVKRQVIHHDRQGATASPEPPKTKRGRGRPSEYDPKLCDELMAHMEQGFSFESFAASVNHSKQTLYNWTREFPEFLDAKKKGEDLCRLFWERKGIDGISTGEGEKFNAVAWIYNMKCRFPEEWREKKELTIKKDEVDEDENLDKKTPEERRGEIETLTAEIQELRKKVEMRRRVITGGETAGETASRA